MFDFDTIKEVFASIGKNKLRTFLTGLAIAWGIFLLIILLGIGNGFQNGVTSNFSSRAQNEISISPGWTSMPYGGLPINRRMKLDMKDYDLIKFQMPNVEYISRSISKMDTMSYGEEFGFWSKIGVEPQMALISGVKPHVGRFINDLDMKEKRKIIVLTTEMEEILFKGESGLGKKIKVGNLIFTVIGIYKEKNGRFNPLSYIPFTTAQSLYKSGYGFDQIQFTVLGLDTEEANEEYETVLRKHLGRIHNFNPEDRSAVWITSSASWAIEAQKIFTVIRLFIIVIGLASLMAGIVGVGNIMLITVKERTKEIGIRKALGATPISILKLIIMEGVLITSIFGLIGMMIGIGITEAVALGLEQMSANGGAEDGNMQPTMFLGPTVDVWVVLSSTALLIVIGVLAGMLAARKALRVSPIEAMRAD